MAFHVVARCAARRSPPRPPATSTTRGCRGWRWAGPDHARRADAAGDPRALGTPGAAGRILAIRAGRRCNPQTHFPSPVELRPPRAELESAAGIDAWIDTYHAIRGLVRQGVRVMVTDSAVGAQEENNLRHLVNNLGPDVPRDRVVPFLTTKHSLEFCLAYADQVVQHGFPALVVLGGDKHVGRAAIGRARLAAAAADSPAPSRPAARRLGQPGGRSGSPGRVRRRRRVHRRLLPDARSSRTIGSASRGVPGRGRPGRRDRPRRLRRLLLPQRQAGHARRAEPVPAGADR